MYQTITESDFHDAFRNQGRGDQFSYEALDALFEYLEELEKDTGQQIELDVVGLCCEWAECDLAKLQQDYPDHAPDDPDDLSAWEEALTDYTTVIKTDNDTLLFVQF